MRKDDILMSVQDQFLKSRCESFEAVGGRLENRCIWVRGPDVDCLDCYFQKR